MQKNIKKNYIYNLIYQVVSLITPLIVTPYIARVLGTSGVGQYSFTYSISTYFILFGALGFGYYAQREVARFQGNKEEQSKIFFEIIIARLISVGASLLLYFGLLLSGIYGDSYTVLMWILSINVVSTAFDVTFLFQGNEEFGIVALRNILIKIAGVVVIFVFVKNESHTWLYALCQAIIMIVSNLSLWPSLHKRIGRVKFSELNIKRHFVPTLRLFVPTIAVSVYTVLDKTLIGLLVPGTVTVDGVEKNLSDIENGFYDQAEKMVKIAMTIITSLGTVMIPRNSNAVAEGNLEIFKNNVLGALRFVFFLGVPIMFGLAGIATNFSPWFFGPGYEKVPMLIIIMSPLVIVIGLSNVLGLQYLIPQKKDRLYTFAITGGALVNLVLNIPLILFFQSYGASIATVVAELVVTIAMLAFARRDIKFFEALKASWKYFISGVVMLCAVLISSYFLEPKVINTLILIGGGSLLYFLILVLLRDKMLLNVLSGIKKKFSKKEQKE